MNRWFRLWSAFVGMVMIGNLQYAWTLFAEPMVKAHATQHWQLSDVQWGFGLFIAAGTWTMPFLASFIDKTGPRVLMVFSGLLCAVDDRIRGLDSGADDYLVKPFEFAELLARLRALIRRGGAKQMPVIEIDDLRIDTRSRRVTRAAREIVLTAKEYALLEYMAMHAGRVIGREEIADHVWNEEFDAFSNLIEVYINRLRRAIDRDHDHKLIHTVRGAGYRLE